MIQEEDGSNNSKYKVIMEKSQFFKSFKVNFFKDLWWIMYARRNKVSKKRLKGGETLNKYLGVSHRHREATGKHLHAPDLF